MIILCTFKSEKIGFAVMKISLSIKNTPPNYNIGQMNGSCRPSFLVPCWEEGVLWRVCPWRMPSTVSLGACGIIRHLQWRTWTGIFSGMIWQGTTAAIKHSCFVYLSCPTHWHLSQGNNSEKGKCVYMKALVMELCIGGENRIILNIRETQKPNSVEGTYTC